MARTVSEAFRLLLSQVEPTGPEDSARRSHVRTIKQGLEAEFNSVSKVEVIGSHTRDSAIHIHSDVDYLAVLSKADVTRGGDLVRSSTTLERVRDALEDRLPKTEIWIDGPAVIVGFGQGEGAVDVVPAFWTGTVSSVSGYPKYGIPDGEGGWLETSPQYHGKYIKDANDKAAGKLATTAKFLKVWKYARDPALPCLGFHVELLLASEGTCNGARTYGGMLLDAFKLLRDRSGRGLNDPRGVSPRVKVIRSEAERKRLVEAATYAADHAGRGITAEVEGKIDEAFRQWDLVFNDEFPAR
jgi:hypothetical protein